MRRSAYKVGGCLAAWCLTGAPGTLQAEPGGWLEVAPTVEITSAWDHRFLPASSPESEVERLSHHAAGWLGVMASTRPERDYAVWSSYAALGVRVEPPSPGRVALVPMIRVGHRFQRRRDQEQWMLDWLFTSRYGLSAGAVFHERGALAAGRAGVHAQMGVFVFELVTELDTARRAPRWIFSGGVGF